MNRNALKGYRAIQAAGKIEGATPHRLTALLFEAALSAIDAARLAETGETSRRSIDKALAIVSELQTTLKDPDSVPLAGQLYSLYGYVQTQLLEASRFGNQDALDNARLTLVPLQDAWRAIGTRPEAMPGWVNPRSSRDASEAATR